MVGQKQCRPQRRCHPMGLQPLLCSLPSPGWFMVTVSPPAKTTATAWLRSPVMREAASTCEIRAWYHLSGSGEGAHGGHGRASGYHAQGSDNGGSGDGQGHLTPWQGQSHRHLEMGPCHPTRLFHAPQAELAGPRGPGSSLQSWRGLVHPHGYPRMPSAKGHVLGLPAGLNQTERPVLRLAVAYRAEVVGLWQSPKHGGEGWHQLVAYPGRIAEQFQVRQGSVGTRAPFP